MTYNPLDHSLYIIGGFSEISGFNDNVLQLSQKQTSANLIQNWPTSGLSPLQGIYGHSTVFHAKLQSFYVYGGITYSNRSVNINYKCNFLTLAHILLYLQAG